MLGIDGVAVVDGLVTVKGIDERGDRVTVTGDARMVEFQVYGYRVGDEG